MKDPAISVARINARAARERQQLEILRELLRNPVIEILVLYIAIEALQKQGIIGSFAGTVAEGAGLGAIGLQQIAPLMPSMAEKGQMLEAVAKIMPSALSLGAGAPGA